MRLARKAAIVMAVLAACGCGRQTSRNPPGPHVERLAILRFENLGPDPGVDWMGRAFAEIITNELTGTDANPIPASRMHSLNQSLGVRPIAAPGISSERSLALASGATRIGYGTYDLRGGRLEAQLTIEDTAAEKTIEVLSTAAPAGNVLEAASGLARQLSRQTRPYGTSRVEALKAWMTALESADPGTVTQSLQSAIAADPDFGPPYLLLAEKLILQRDRPGAIDVLEKAMARGDQISPESRARFELEMADLRQDSAARRKAIEAMVKLEPRDAPAWRSLGEIAMANHDYAAAIQGFQKSLEFEPENGNTWNQLGYAKAYTGDLNGALGALRQYQALRPADSDPLDSQGDVHLLLGRLREAEDLYLQAARKSPAFPNAPDMYKAAMARLMTGDIPGADAIAKQFIDARKAAHDPVVDYFEAEWMWVSGRRKQAYDRLAGFAQSASKAESAPMKELASNACAELALWSLFLGDRAAAGQMLQKSPPPAGASPGAIVLLARFLSQPPAPAAEWAARAERELPQSNGRDAALAYALILNREFEAAAPILKQLYEHGGPASDDTVRILLGWALLETGHATEAPPLLGLNPIPQLNGPGPLVSFYFPRVFYLRALAAAKDSHADTARANDRLFLQLSGPDPLLWGEEQKAQAAQ